MDIKCNTCDEFHHEFYMHDATTCKGCKIESLEESENEIRQSIASLVGAISSINRMPQHEVFVPEDEEPCYWQRKEWVDWIYEISQEIKEKHKVFL